MTVGREGNRLVISGHFNLTGTNWYLKHGKRGKELLVQ